MATPSWLQNRTLKTRPDRPDDPPLESFAEGPRTRQRRVQAPGKAGKGQGWGPAEAQERLRNHEREQRRRSLVRHASPEVEELARTMYNAWKRGTGHYTLFEHLDDRRSIFGHVSPKEQWWGCAMAVLVREERPEGRGYGCIVP